MKRTSLLLLGVLGTLTLSSPVLAQVQPAPALLNFQGRLAKPDGTPVPDGTYAVRFSLWNVASGGVAANEKWNQTVANITVKNGVFAVLLGNGSAFPTGLFNENLWLEIKIGNDPALTPRQQLVSVAFAMKANTVPDGAIGTNQLGDGAVTNVKIATGTITADRFASNIFNPLAWLLGGNSGTNPANNFLGTTDNQPLVFKVNNKKAGQLQFATNGYNTLNVLFGSEVNALSAGVRGGTISGGGLDNLSGTDQPNKVTSDFGTVSGGFDNTAGYIASVGGGQLNNASGGGASIGGGFTNVASGTYARVGGGQLNTVSGSFALVAGGQRNAASADGGTVGGGDSNTASGALSTVPGGAGNTALGGFSFAAGRQAKANHDGAFVWADSQFADFASTAANQFLIRAGGGIGINKANPAAGAFDVNGIVVATGLRLPTGATAGSMLIGDASGNATWQPSPWQSNGSLVYNSTANAVLGSSTLNNPSGFNRVFNVVAPGSAALVTTDSTNNRSWSAGIVSDGNFAFFKTGNGGGNVVVPVLQITGGSDVAEPFDVRGGVKPGMVVSIDAERVGDLRLASRAYDKTVAGIVSGANGVKPGLTLTQEGTDASGKYPVAMTGRVWCWCDADRNGSIKPGDLLTTSATPGYAMKATDYRRAQGAILGKAMSRLAKGRGLVLVLVRPQ